MVHLSPGNCLQEWSKRVCSVVGHSFIELNQNSFKSLQKRFFTAYKMFKVTSTKYDQILKIDRDSLKALWHYIFILITFGICLLFDVYQLFSIKPWNCLTLWLEISDRTSLSMLILPYLTVSYVWNACSLIQNKM